MTFRFLSSIFIVCLLCSCRPAITDSDQRSVATPIASELLIDESAPESPPDHEDPRINELFFRFLESPDRESYLAVRSALVSSEYYDPCSDEMEGFIAATCCEGIISTGEGSKDDPYAVVRTSDEHDVIQYLGKQFIGQSLIRDGDRHFDMVKCDDGSELWFDVTDAFGALQDLYGDGAP